MPWDEGFCHGLIKSHAFVPLLSRQAINHSEVAHQNFEKLTTDSRCDNVYLEYRLALELREMGLVEKIFPVMIGDCVAAADTSISADEEGKQEETLCSASYTHYFSSGCHPNNASTTTVATVETALRTHLDNEGLGSPYTSSESPHSVLSQITQNQGGFVTGNLEDAFSAIVDTIVDMIHPSDGDGDGGQATAGLELNNSKQFLAKEQVMSVEEGGTSGKAHNVPGVGAGAGVGIAVAALKARIESLTEENHNLKLEQEKKNTTGNSNSNNNLQSSEKEAVAAAETTIKALQDENRRLKVFNSSSHSGKNNGGGGKNKKNKNVLNQNQNTKKNANKKIEKIPSAFAQELSKFDKGIEVSFTPSMLECDSEEIKKLAADSDKK